MNTVKAVITKGSHRVRTAPLWQYDYGQILQIVGVELPQAYEVHFGNSEEGNSTTSIGNAEGVVIPDTYLRSGETVYAWLYLHTGESDGETVYHIVIPVRKRAKITDQQPTPVQQDVIDQTIAALNAAVESVPGEIDEALAEAKASGEFDGAPGQDGQDGQDGFSPVVSVETISGGHSVSVTDARGTETFNVMDGVDGQDGQPGSPGKDGQDGAPGQDGYSPTATVTKSGKVATITITDKNGTTSATVSDGEDGSDVIDDTAGSGTTNKTWSANKLMSAINVLEPAATSGDVGKFLKAKTVADGKVTEYEFGEASGGGVSDVQVNGDSVVSQGIATIPNANGNNFGVVKQGTNTGYGIYINSGIVSISPATDAQVKNGTETYKPVCASRQHMATFFGLAKAAGSDMSGSSNSVGTYTESAKSAISQMLDAPETVSGSTPTITAKAGVRYICGECSTLTIVVPASGCIDVVFESGSTATVLTVTPPTGVTAVKFPAWFNPSSLSANTTYEINILDGKFGTVMAWT